MTQGKLTIFLSLTFLMNMNKMMHIEQVAHKGNSILPLFNTAVYSGCPTPPSVMLNRWLELSHGDSLYTREIGYEQTLHISDFLNFFLVDC